MIDFYLRVFLASAKICSFTKASELLHITQPGVTHHIRKLEEMFETRLFIRQRNRIRLTKAGEVLYRYADEMDRLYRQATIEMSKIKSSVSGDVQFGVTSLLGIYLIPMLLGEFRQRYPNVNLSMQMGNSREVMRCLRDGIIEMGIVSEPIQENRFVTLPFYQDDLTLIVPPDHPWCRKKTIDAESIFDENFIIREPGSGTREVYMKALKDLYSRKKLRIAMVLGSTEAIKRGVIGKLGVSIVSHLACRLETEQGVLQKVRVKGLNMKRNFGIVYRSEEDLSVQAMKWKEFLIEQRDRQFRVG